MKRRWVFEELVRNEQDTVGLVAYALYKFHKHKLASSLRDQGRNEAEIQEQVSTFHDQSLNNGSMEEYRNRATNFLNNIFSEIEQKFSAEFEQKERQLKKDLDKDKKKSRRDFIKGVQEYERINKSWIKRIGLFLISGIPSLMSSILISILVFGSLVLFLPEEQKKGIFLTIAEQYFGFKPPREKPQTLPPARPSSPPPMDVN